MKSTKSLAVLIGLLMAGSAVPALAQSHFNRIASFPVTLNAPDAEETSSEIITASDDGMVLIYSDSPGGGIGFIDITDPAAPQAAGYLVLDGEPTSVVASGAFVFAGVNTSEDYVNTSGNLAVISLETQQVVSSCDLGGQPDSVAKARDGSMIAVAIENERDEDLNDGVIPQAPAGFVVVLDVTADGVDCTNQRVIDVAGLADIAGQDPEPEFVDFNEAGELVLTMQENNYIVLMDAASGEVTGHFSAGAVDLTGIDTEEDGRFDFTGHADAVVREPDAVKWLDNDRFVTANEGDYEGGSRGFSIFSRDGAVLFDSGNSVDMIAASLGHYPEGRSDAKGSEPEGMEIATFGDDTYFFLLLERASLVLVYKDTGGEPEYVQALPSGIGPEGGVAIPSRNLFVTANETDLRADGLAGSHVMLFELQDAAPAYPTLVADMDGDQPRAWVALSGMVADDEQPGILYGVNDSFMGMQPMIMTIDATSAPARITDTVTVTRGGAPAQLLDLEGITTDGEGGFWLASEGRTDRVIPHALYHVNADGEIEEEIGFPPALMDNEIRFGSEGVTRVGEGDDSVLWIAIQREWRDDPANHVKLVSYQPSTGEWGAVLYPKAEPDTGWVGLSEITAHGDYVYIVERDNQIAGNAVLKHLYRVPLAEMLPAELGGELRVVSKELVRDLLPDLASFNGYVVDKIEGFAIDANGEGFVSTDNDGVDDSSGETFFWSIGTM